MALPAPQNVTATATDDDITVSWDDVDGGTGEYRVYRSTSSGVSTSDTQVATVTDDDSASYSVTDSNLSLGTTYYYAVDSVGPIIDGFEGGDTSDYSDVPSGASVSTDSPVVEGQNSLKIADDGSSVNVIMHSGSLTTLPSRGDTFSAYMYAASGGEWPQYFFAYTDDSTNYGVRMNTSGDEIEISKGGPTNNDVVSSGSATMSSGTWYEVETDFQSTITATVYDIDTSDLSRNSELGSTTYTDDSHDSGDVGWCLSNNQGTEAVFDYAGLIS